MSNLFNQLLKALEDTETEAPKLFNKSNEQEVKNENLVGGSETSSDMPDGTVNLDSATSSQMPNMESSGTVDMGMNTTTTISESSQVGGLNKLLNLLDVTETEENNQVTETEELENQLKNLLEQSGGAKIKKSSKRSSQGSKRSSQGSKKSYTGMPPAIQAFNKLSVVVVAKLGVKAGVPSKRAAKIVKDHVAERPENQGKTSLEITETAIKELEVGKDIEKYKKMVANI